MYVYIASLCTYIYIYICMYVPQSLHTFCAAAAVAGA